MLQVREVPQHIYEKLCDLAKREHRSLAQQTVVVLAKGLELELEPRERRRRAVREIRAMDKTPFKNLADPVKLIREDRTR